MYYRNVTVSLFNHSLVGEVVHNQDGKSRHLSEPGCNLALYRRAQLEEPDFDLLISSPAERSIHTLKMIAGLRYDSDQVLILNELYPEGEDIERALRQLKESPYRAYLGDAHGRCIHEKCTIAAHSLMNVINTNRGLPKIGVGGQGVLLNGMAIKMLPGEHPAVPILSSYVLGPAEGIELQLHIDTPTGKAINAEVTLITNTARLSVFQYDEIPARR